MSAKINDGLTPQQRYYEKNKEEIKKKRKKEWWDKKKKRLELKEKDIFYNIDTHCWGNPSEWQEDSYKTKLRYAQAVQDKKTTARQDAMVLRFLLHSIFWYYRIGYYQKDRSVGVEGSRFQSVWRATYIAKYMQKLNKNITSRYVGILANCIGLYRGNANFGYLGGRGSGLYGPLRLINISMSEGTRECHPMPFYCGDYQGIHGKVAKEGEILERALLHLNIVRKTHGLEQITKEIMDEVTAELEDVLSDRMKFMLDAGIKVVDPKRCDEEMATLDKEIESIKKKSVMDVI